MKVVLKKSGPEGREPGELATEPTIGEMETLLHPLEKVQLISVEFPEATELGVAVIDTEQGPLSTCIALDGGLPMREPKIPASFESPRENTLPVPMRTIKLISAIMVFLFTFFCFSLSSMSNNKFNK